MKNTNELKKNSIYLIRNDLNFEKDFEIPEGVSLFLFENVNIKIKCKIDFQGLPSNPISIVPFNGSQFFGSFRLESMKSSLVIQSSLFAGGGNDNNSKSNHFGHSKSAPLFFASNRSSIRIENFSAILDCIGKGFGIENHSSLTIDESIIARLDTGAEIDNSFLKVRNTLFSEFPNALDERKDDDNDALYIKNNSNATIENCRFFIGEDDAIDHNAASFLEISNSWIQGFVHEAIATSGLPTKNETFFQVNIDGIVIVGCNQAIEIGYGVPKVELKNSILIANGIAIRYGDECKFLYFQ